MSRGVRNVWIEKSLQKLAISVPARYDKPEETSGIISSLGTYIFAVDRPAPADSVVAKTGESATAAPALAKEPGSVTESETAAPAQGDRTDQPPVKTGEATRR
jgi:hypothetical protein